MSMGTEVCWLENVGKLDTDKTNISELVEKQMYYS